MAARAMEIADLRIALFSGNYNMVRDGANQALNRLVEYLLRQGAAVRVYSPTIAEPAVRPDRRSGVVPSVPIPGRSEYRFPLSLTRGDRGAISRRSSPTWCTSPRPTSCRTARSPGRAIAACRCSPRSTPGSRPTRAITASASLEPLIEAMLRRFYRRCDALVAPSQSMVEVLREQRMNYDVGIWSRGVDRAVFGPDKRDLAWRRELGLRRRTTS